MDTKLLRYSTAYRMHISQLLHVQSHFLCELKCVTNSIWLCIRYASNNAQNTDYEQNSLFGKTKQKSDQASNKMNLFSIALRTNGMFGNKHINTIVNRGTLINLHRATVCISNRKQTMQIEIEQ